MSNLTSFGHANAGKTEGQSMSYETMSKVMETSRIIVIPIVSALGMVGNLLSIAVLFKHGFRKSSNVILFVLAVVDLITLITINKQFIFVRKIPPTEKSVAQFWYVTWQIFRMFGMAAEYMSLGIPSLITMERLTAVFFPLRFHRIVTPLRTWLVLAIVFGLWFAKFLHSTVYFYRLYLRYDPVLNMSLHKVGLTRYYVENYDFYYNINYTVVILGSTVPSVLTAVGCFVISVKLRFNAHKRKKMTSSAKAWSTTQTTRTLLAVCFVYLVMCTYKWILNIPQLEDIILNPAGSGLVLTNLGFVVYEGLAILSYFNNSFNFVVYVGLNKKFRDTLKSMLPRPCRSRPVGSDKKAPRK